jgi:hypothetical protein
MISAFSNLEFLQAKIVEQYQEATEMGRDDVSNTRFGALNMDLVYISSSPWYGNGIHNSTRYRFHPWVNEDIGHGNGLSNFIVYWGIPLFFFWVFSVYRYFLKWLHQYSLAVLAVIMVLLELQGEQFLNYPVFLTFFFFSIFASNNNTP